MNVARIGRVPRNPAFLSEYGPDHPMVDQYGKPTTWDEPGCTELVYVGKPAYPTLESVTREYVSEHVIPSGGDQKRALQAMRDWFVALDPQKDARTMTRADGRAVVDLVLSRENTPATARRILTVGAAALNHAKKEERIEKVPKFQMPPAAHSRIRVVTREEERRLMLLPKPRRVQLSLLLAFETGARAEAIEQLTWSRCNLDTRTIDYRVPGVRYKNKRRPVVPINDHLLARLQAAKLYHDAHRPDDPYVIGLSPRGRVASTYHKVVECWEALGLREKGMCRHVARHTFATRLLEAGTPIHTVAMLMGDTVAMVEKTYGHVQPLAMLSAANRLH